MLDLLEKELAINGVRILQGGVVEIDGKINLSPREAIFHFKRKAKYFYKVVSKIWNDIIPIVNTVSINAGEPSEGLRDIFINSLQEMKRLIRIYPFLENHKMIDFAIANALSRDINTFSYRTMSRVIESKLAIDWISHLVKRNVYICALIGYTYSMKRQAKKVNAAGVGGPFSNLDLPLKERCFEWSEIDEEVRGRSSDLQNQRRYKMGLEGYHDLWPQEGFVWRELKNEPYLWAKKAKAHIQEKQVNKMKKMSQQSLLDVLIQIMPALQDLRLRTIKKDDPNNNILLSMWENSKDTAQRKFAKPLNISKDQLNGLRESGLIEEQGNYIKITEKGAQAIKVMILNDNSFALSKKASSNYSLGWYSRLKNENYLS